MYIQKEFWGFCCSHIPTLRTPTKFHVFRNFFNIASHIVNLTHKCLSSEAKRKIVFRVKLLILSQIYQVMDVSQELDA